MGCIESLWLRRIAGGGDRLQRNDARDGRAAGREGVALNQKGAAHPACPCGKGLAVRLEREDKRVLKLLSYGTQRAVGRYHCAPESRSRRSPARRAATGATPVCDTPRAPPAHSHTRRPDHRHRATARQYAVRSPARRSPARRARACRAVEPRRLGSSVVSSRPRHTSHSQSSDDARRARCHGPRPDGRRSSLSL